MISVINRAYFLNLNQSDSSRESEELGEVCLANISPLERQKRLRFGIQQLIVTLLILGVLIALHVNPLWRLPLLFLFWASAVGYFQARDKT
jgi:hypothetical protein